MVLFWITLALAIIGSNADGEFCVLYSPDSLKFTQRGAIWESILKEVFSAALGLSVEHNAEWDGLYIMDAFNTPEAVVNVHIDGVSSLGQNFGLQSKVYRLLVDEFEPDTFNGVQLRIKQRLDVGNNQIFNIKLFDSNLFNTYRTGTSNSKDPNIAPELNHLKTEVEEDRMFLEELGNLRLVIENIKDLGVSDRIIDFFNFRLRSLHTLSDFYGPFSAQIKEAMKLLGDALQELSKEFVKAYDGSVLVTVVTTDVAHSRRSARSAMPDDDDATTETPTSPTTGKEAPSEEGPPPPPPEETAPMFNVILWFSLLMVFVMLAIVHACMDMDPGRDTIIYRMTAPRPAKKDK